MLDTEKSRATVAKIAIVVVGVWLGVCGVVWLVLNGGHVGVASASTITQPPAYQLLELKSTTSDTLTCAQAGSLTAHATTYTIPANYLTTNRVVKATWSLSLDNDLAENVNTQYQFYIDGLQSVTMTNTANSGAGLSYQAAGMTFLIQAIDPPSAASNVNLFNIASGGGGTTTGGVMSPWAMRPNRFNYDVLDTASPVVLQLRFKCAGGVSVVSTVYSLMVESVTKW